MVLKQGHHRMKRGAQSEQNDIEATSYNNRHSTEEGYAFLISKESI